jgi:hypothetical protein
VPLPTLREDRYTGTTPLRFHGRWTRSLSGIDESLCGVELNASPLRPQFCFLKFDL